MKSVVLAAVLLATVGSLSPAWAQEVRTATELVDRLFVPGVPFNPDNEPLLSLDEYQRRQRDSREGIAIGVLTALASFPLGASSAGFTYVQDPVTGERALKSVSFGSVFVERALTNGRGVFNAGVTYQASRFDTLQGIDLQGEGFVTQSQLGVYTIDGSDVGDIWRARLDVESRAFIVSGSYGVTEHVDFGWVIPVASVTMRGQFLRDYNGGLDWDADLRTTSGLPVRNFYPNKTGTVVQIDESVSASGIGDVVLRGKVGLGAASAQVGMVSAEVRLPTGDEENLLGTGKASLRVTAGATAQMASGSASVNAGYTVGGLTDEVNFAGGAEIGLLPRKQLTLSVDLVAQHLRDTVTEVDQLISFDRLTADPARGALERRVRVQYAFWNRGSTTLARAAFGAKYNLGSTWLLTGSVLVRLNTNGYQAKVVPFVGLERNWSRR